MKQFTITGLGPVQQDGSVKLFTVQRAPYIVSADWLKAQSKAPAVGDVLEVTDSGALTLVTETQAATDQANDEPDESGTQKKNPGGADSGAGSEHSPFKQYASKPTLVTAAEITAVGEPEHNGEVTATFADGSTKSATTGMMARYKPQSGDYWVIAHQPHEYEYLNPKDVFEGKYEPVTE